MENKEKLIQEVTEKAQTWLTPAYDEKTQEEIKNLIEAEDKTNLIESFYKDLEFGTGGLRGIMGAGSNRMNIYTVGGATQGFANYLNKSFAGRDKISVAVGHDCRNNSRLFAETVAKIFSANGIHVYLFEDMRPTPELAFAIRHLGCQGGVNITASHNPKEYNGYKAYWEDGAQVLTPHDQGIIDEVAKVTVPDIKWEGNDKLITIIGEEIDKVFLEKVHELSIDPESIKKQKDLSIVYTPLHGTGMTMIPQSLKLWGFENVNCVEEQMVRSGDFPTVVSPNPENAEALTLALKLAKKIDADVVMASDPDADRVAAACKNNEGEWVLINGNQMCLLFTYYIVANRARMGKLQDNDFIVKTIVTTEVIRKVADKFGVEMRDCYTGFKWIAREIRATEGEKNYIGGGEESFGYMAESFCRDKDAVSACSLLGEMCAWAKCNGKTLFDILMDIYTEFGFSKEYTVNVFRLGKTGAEEIQKMMKEFRENPPKEIGGSKVVLQRDFLKLEEKTAEGIKSLEMPATSNVLQWFLENGNKVSVRPSGTEPKIKFYLEVKGTIKSKADFKAADEKADKDIKAIMHDLKID